MDRLTAFGLLAVTAMLVTYALEKRSPWFILAFAGLASWAQRKGFCKVHGRLVSLKPFGLGSLSADTGTRGGDAR
jgi:hypothetical protein